MLVCAWVQRATRPWRRGQPASGLGFGEQRAAELGVPHSPVIDATIGWLLVFHDPDGTELHLYSMERHGLDPSGRPHTGRFVTA